MDLVRQGMSPCFGGQAGRASAPNRALKPPAWLPQVLSLPCCVFGEGRPGHLCWMPPQHPPSLPAVPCERRSSQLPWDRAATIAGPLHPAPAAPLTASCQAILPFLPLQLKHRLFMEDNPIFPSRRAISYSLTVPRARVGCTVGLQRVPSAVSPPSW